MKIEFVKHDDENELDIVLYGLNVEKYQYNQEKIIFHDCLTQQIIAEMEALKLFTRTKKDHLFGLYLSCHQENIHEKMSDQIYFSFDFAYQNNDLIIFYSFDEEDTESELNKFFKRKELIYKYLNGECDQKNWYALSDFDKKCWLDIAYLRAQLEQIDDRIVKEIILDGAYIESELDLYCYIGEEVCGVLGYMGGSSMALRDCLTDEIRPIQYPLRIVWKNFEYSKQKFNQDDIQYFIDLLSQNADLKIC
ncbi:barstar family protein [Acinetobacter dispersus]|uniref:barstar family protein n=1 Tax=Acinetobacter dispersus TaxID=70348 RepID=UPI00132E8ABC|nr:barstar [Acinetobacter dispersus]MCH7390401.1 barstar [Acinetobacter dispersus]QHH96010.1 barstar [Acinetobacter dispersus]